MSVQKITILGATGSIGRSTLDVLKAHPDKFALHAISGGSRVEPLLDIAEAFRPARVAVADERALPALIAGAKARGLTGIELSAGAEASVKFAEDAEADQVVQAIVGAAGLAPTFAAARAGKRLLLANKESVVCGGALLMRTAEEKGAKILPVDSEHSAVFQCLESATAKTRETARIVLTASGGPFRGRKDLSGITPEMAVKHPKWSMGRKISVDSATLMNKGLEVIEASWLFGVPADRIDVVVHPESIIHSMVTFDDGAVLAELGNPDMKTPIAYALSWPERIVSGVAPLDLARIGRLTFEAPDLDTFPLLRIAYEALAAGGDRTIVLNGANEEAVAAFLDHEIGFTAIADTVRAALDACAQTTPASLEEIFAVDAAARAAARRYIERTRCGGR